MEPIRVLIVEDEMVIAQQLAAKLELLGYEIAGIVATGPDAIRETVEKRPDIVLMDIVIKGQMDGIETATALQRDYGVPVIYLTAYADDSTIEMAERSGAQGYVLKPFREREVHAMIKLAMNRHRRTGEISRALRVADQVAGQLRQSIGEVALKIGGLDERSLRDELRAAFDHGQLKVHFQPRVALRDGEIVGAEALLRWNHPRQGMLMPDRFLPIAEEIGLIETLDDWVLRKAIAAATAWRGHRPSFRVTVNVSLASFRHDALVTRMHDILKETGYDPAGLEFDITESVLIQNSEHDMLVLKEVKSAGVGLAVDNFGVGYATISNLQNFPFDTVKIDRSFVRKAASGRNASAVVQAIIQLAEAMGLTTVAEGVETREELRLLCNHGCNDMQGFLFSPAVPGTEIGRLLASGSRLELPTPLSNGPTRVFLAGTPTHAELDPINEQQQELIEQFIERRTRALRDSNAELEAFTYSVSHDLRAPLRAIIGFSILLGNTAREKLDGEESRILDSILRAGRRMSGQIDALLALSRLSRADMRRETLDLSQLAESVVGELAQQYPGLRIEAQIEPGLRAQGDPRTIRSVLENLLDNAAKFSSKQAAARVRFFRVDTDHGSAFCVADEGAGFDMNYADRLFGVFQRLHGEREFPGTGVGLASVKRIVTRHGGRVWAESEPGKGAKFYFTLPSPAAAA